MTQILSLPCVSFPVSTGTNEDWTDAWAYVDASGNPISGAGITLNMMLRRTEADAEAQIVASSVSGSLNGLPQNGTLSWSSTGGMNIVTLAIPDTTMARIAPGSYVGEVQAVAEGYSKTIAQIAVTIVQGIVR
ncbi:hypothetical protein [Methylobacterium sp. SI9]|uniref:hypothetical protein n=1 Tax=Methylobacterium guangdongense TaxID=3138811 RepID=UPI00313E48F2